MVLWYKYKTRKMNLYSVKRHHVKLAKNGWSFGNFNDKIIGKYARHRISILW